jgi:hypothetical protein
MKNSTKTLLKIASLTALVIAAIAVVKKKTSVKTKSSKDECYYL